MRVTRQTIHFSLAFALLVASSAIQSQPLLGQEALEFEVLTGREVSGSGTTGFVPSTSPGNQLDGMSVRRHRVRTRPVSHPNVAQLPSSSTYVPRHQRMVGMREVGDTSIIETVPGKTVYQDVGGVMPMAEPCMDGSCGQGHGPVGCDSCGNQGCNECIPCPRFSLKNMQFIFGAQGFLSPRDMFTDQSPYGGGLPHSSFGFHGGANWGFHFPCVTPEIAFQLGALFTSSNYDGELFTNDTRNQTFLTGGFYRRVDWGLQGGLVIDYVNDKWYADHQLIQLRGELSWVFQNCFEFGFNFAGSTRTSQSSATFNVFPPTPGQPNTFNETRQALDNYRFFVRQRFQRGGEGRIFGGWTEDGDGLVGADFTLPISCDWGVQGGFTYVAPQNDNQQAPPSNYDYDNELWNVSVSLVWYPGGFDTVFCKYNRPLFNVADNGTLLQKINRP